MPLSPLFPRVPFFPFRPLSPFSPLGPGRPGRPGGPEKHAPLVDLQSRCLPSDKSLCISLIVVAVVLAFLVLLAEFACLLAR